MDLNNQQHEPSTLPLIALDSVPEYVAWNTLRIVLSECRIKANRPQKKGNKGTPISRLSWNMICTAKNKGRCIGELKKIAQLCEERGYDLYDFFKTMLSYYTKAYESIKIKDFLNSDSIAKYEAERGDIKFKERYLGQVRYCRSTSPQVIPRIYQTENDFLLDPHQPFDPWFRILHTNHLDMRIFALYGNEANKEIYQNGALHKFLTTLDGTIIDLSRIVGKTYG